MSTDVVCISPIQANAAEVEQGRLKEELRILRRRGARNASGEEVSQGRSCARCKAPLGRIYNTGASCTRCRHRVCRQCREYRGSNGTDWLCIVCHKITEIQAVSGEWMNDASGTNKRSVVGRRKFLASPADILKRSIRRSWTINGPPASWCAERGSPELRAYQSLPRHQDYFEVSRSDLVIPDGSNAEEIKKKIKKDAVVDGGLQASDDLNTSENKREKSAEAEVDCSAEEENIGKFLKSEDQPSPQEITNTPRISQIKPPRIHSKFNFPEVKQNPVKSAERKSNIPILRRSSKEFEDIRSPIESAKRSLIPQRYRGSTDDLRRSREDITGPSQIPKLFSPRLKEDRLIVKRQDSKDEIIRCGIKLPSFRKEDRKEARDIHNASKSAAAVAVNNLSKKEDENRGDIKSGIKIFRRENSREGIDPLSKDQFFPSSRVNNKLVNKEGKNPCDDKEEEKEAILDDETKKCGAAAGVKETKTVCGKNDKKYSPGNDFKENLNSGEDMLDKKEPPNSKETGKNERKFEGFKWEKFRRQNDNDNEKSDSVDEMEKKDGIGLETGNDNNCQEEKEASDNVDSNNPAKKQQEDYQVVARRKFSKEEFSNPDDTDEVHNRRSSSHLSPEASPLSTRSSRYSPRESESEPTPALPRKAGESISASQRVRDAITRTRRESNSSARYESSGSESVRLTSQVETRRVRFGGGSGIEEVQRDSATSAGEDEPRNSAHNPGGQRDSRTNPGAIQGRAVRRRRQFDTQGSRRRGRSHARGCVEDFHHLQGRCGSTAAGHLSPTQGGQQGQDQPIIDYRRLVFISSDSSSGREEDDADSSSGSSSLNGAPRSSLTQGLEDCDWDYFESGGSVPPLAHLQVGIVAGNSAINANASNPQSQGPHAPHSTRVLHGSGISLSSQDWSCCPGRGSAACQACGGARGANVFPVPVPIPVPVPYPVPVPASLWTTGLNNTSMINCTSAELGALQLSRGGSSQWFAWPPRFIHDVNVARPNDAATFAFHQSREFGQINYHAGVVAGAEFNNGNEKNEDVINKQETANEQTLDLPAADKRDEETAATTADEPEDASTSDCTDEELKTESKSNFGNSTGKKSAKMYRLTQGNSGSSSGRSSADSSDLEDSAASHHFSRVFVVNDDSSTSDNDPEDVEDLEDSDSNREVGITLRRVTALPEDGPVVLRHVRFLDEDSGPVESKKNTDDGEKNEAKTGREENIRLRYLRTLDPEANEIYLVDSKDDDSEHRIELKSVRSIDPEVIIVEEDKTVDRFVTDVGGTGSDTSEPDSLMPETLAESSTIVPDSLEINGVSMLGRPSSRSSSTSSSSSVASVDGIPDDGDICAFESPETNDVGNDKQRGDKRTDSLSDVCDDTVTTAAIKSSRVSPTCHGAMTSELNSKKAQAAGELSLNITGNSERSTTGSSEATTGSELSSDELHEYEITAWSSPREEEEEEEEEDYGAGEEFADQESPAFGAVNNGLIIARNLLTNEDDDENKKKKFGVYESDDNAADNHENLSGFTSDGFSTDEGGSSRLDSGVATGVEDTNASGRTDDGSTASFETSTPGESIELVHSTGDINANVAGGGGGGGGGNDEAVVVGDSESRTRVSGGKLTQDENNRDIVNEAGDNKTVNDLISTKIHEIFKSVETISANADDQSRPNDPTSHEFDKNSITEERSAPIILGGESNEAKQVVVEAGVGPDRSGTASSVCVSPVERRPPVVKDGYNCAAAGAALSCHLGSNAVKNVGKNCVNGNRYKSLVMITQGAYQPVNVVTSDTTTLLQPDDSQTPPRGLAGYYHLALETAAEIPLRNGTSGTRRPPTVKRSNPQQRAVNIEPEVDSGLSVGSASESDDVQSVKSASKEQSANERVFGVNETPANRSRALEATSGVVVILEEGLADDDSWVEEVSHDEDEQGATTATEESSEDEAHNLQGDREEELRGYHRQAIDFTLHTIVEESCEESEAEPSSLAIGSPRKQRPPSASELEKYFFFGLGDGAGNAGSAREVDSLSETSSIYSEGLESLGQDEAPQNPGKNSPDYLASSSRLEKYFLSDFLGFDRDRRDSDGSVGSDSEGRPSPEQRRKRLVRARGTGRSHSSSLDNLLALTQSSANLSSQNSLQDLSLNPETQETQSEGSSTETDGADDQTPAFGTDGQFDTVKRKKKKPRNLGTQSPRIPDDRNKTPEPNEPDADQIDAANSDDDRAKTPQPDAVSQSAENSRANQAADSAHQTAGRKQQQQDSARATGGGGQVNEANLQTRGKQHSRDSGFIGSCDDLLQHQRVTGSSEGQNSAGFQDQGKKESVNDRRANNDAKYKDAGASGRVEPASQPSLAPPNASLSRKDSFNNWSSDEETNLMMSKMRQFFKTMVANSNSNNSSAASPAPSPRLPGSSPRSRTSAQNRTKPPQLVYFENELTRLMKTVPGIRDEQVKEIVEYLSSEDTWSDSYDSSDYTSSDLESAGGRRSALQEQISQSCQQIISKFDTTAEATLLAGKETPPSAQPTQPLSCRDTAFVYQKLVQSFTKMTGDGVSSDASSTPHSSPPLIAKVMHHIGSRLVALMHEVSEGGPAVQPASWRRYPHHRTPSSASTTEDDDSTSDSANTPAQHQLPRSKSHDPLLLLNGHPAAGYQEGEEREASDNERFSWRGSFESALMPADSRTKLSLLACSGDVSASASALAMAAKRRSAGDLLFNPKSLSREQLDRVRSCGSIGGGTAGSVEDRIWSNRRRSSVPDANTRGESGASAGDDDTEDELEYGGDSRATTLPRGLQAAATATNSLPRLPPVSTTSGPVTMHKAHSVHHFLQQHNNVKSARYRPPGFARNNLTAGGGGGTGGPKRAVSAPGLQLNPGTNPVSKRENARSRRQAVSLTPDDGSSLTEACSTPIIGGVRGGSLSTDDDMDRSLHTSLLGNRASSSSLGARSDSMASVYSGAGEGRWCGSVAVRGEVEFALEYDYKQKTFEVRVTQCRDLAPVDVKRNRSDPYVKVYLLPDKSKGGKRKTKVKKHTLNPVFDETLKFHMSLNGLETRTLWLTVWHSDMFGRNDFLGEVRMALENKIFDDLTPRWYPLQERSEPFDDPITCKGEVIVGLKFVPPDPTQQNERIGDRAGIGDKVGSKARKSWSKGALHVLVKEARNLQTRAKHGGTCDPFCKSYLLPDKGRSGKQKTGVVRKCTGGSPVWGHTFVYKDVSLQELAERGLELTVWDHDRIASNEFLGGVRFNLGTGKNYGKPVEWMDATGRELSLWQDMLERPNFWVEGAVTLRPNLHNHSRNNTS